MQATLLVIAGPTAVGKTLLSIQLAQHFNTEIISADSRQFYKELSIGTTKPSIEEMQGVKHHFVDSHSIHQDFNVNEYEQEVIPLLNELFQTHPIVILTGGSGLYLDAICNGFDADLPEGNPEIREELNQIYQKYGIGLLQEKLKQLDLDFYNEIDLHNTKRVIRAIEVCILAKQPYSKLRKGKQQLRNFNVIKIALNRPKEALNKRINQRVDEMMEMGLLAEVESVLPFKNKNALNTVGYKELFDYLEKQTTLEQAIEKIKVNSRRYAKRQIAWFKRSADYKWFHPNQQTEIIEFIEKKLITK
ncbi:MAG: tRNA (adenosine(37)-N6)-dimethylallyltransferase MiaA [Vicingaceae bacterium]|nr:tRNA (adenosine(37)-N6)-dimethylallyltransferase MiaA [Vicingaceae bacterium]